MAFDMIQAGIDTSGNSAGFLLYNLAKNPEKQEKLRKEILEAYENTTSDGYLKEKQVVNLRYLKACIKESLRVTPTIQVTNATTTFP